MGHCQFDRWPTSMENTWDIFQETINDLQQDFDIRTHAFVLMGNHYHWLCTYDIHKDPEFFNWFHELLNCHFLKFLPSFAESIYTLDLNPKIVKIENFPQYKATYRYVYNNPIGAGLSSCPFDYPFSTLPYVMGKQGLNFNVIDNMGAIFSPTTIRSWLNREMELWAQ